MNYFIIYHNIGLTMFIIYVNLCALHGSTKTVYGWFDLHLNCYLSARPLGSLEHPTTHEKKIHSFPWGWSSNLWYIRILWTHHWYGFRFCGIDDVWNQNCHVLTLAQIYCVHILWYVHICSIQFDDSPRCSSHQHINMSIFLGVRKSGDSPIYPF